MYWWTSLLDNAGVGLSLFQFWRWERFFGGGDDEVDEHRGRAMKQRDMMRELFRRLQA
jgi:hypothetical protein